MVEALRQAGSAMPKRHDLAKAAGLTEAELTECLAQLMEEGRVVELGGRYVDHDTIETLWGRR